MASESRPKKNANKNRLVIPRDIKEALMRNRKAWENFSAFAPGSKHLYVDWIKEAKKEDTRKRRIDKAVKAAVHNVKYPMT